MAKASTSAKSAASKASKKPEAAEHADARASCICDHERFEVSIRLVGHIEVKTIRFDADEMRNEPLVGNRLREFAERLMR